MDITHVLRIALWLTIAVLSFVAYQNPTRNTATRIITDLLTRRNWILGYPRRTQLMVVCVIFSIVTLVDLYWLFGA